MKLKADRILVIGFIAVLFLSSLTFFVFPIQRFSELENRYLQSVPQFTWESLFNRQFAQETDAFISDHFPFRKQWVWLKSAGEQLRGQVENNGIYKGKEGYLLEKFAQPDYTNIKKYTDALVQFASYHPSANMTFMLAPTSIGLYPERLPWMAPTYAQKNVNQYVSDQINGTLSFIDGFNFLSETDAEQLYYRNDHHWTTYAAYLAYVAYAEKSGWEPVNLDAFTIQTVSQSFLGSYHTRSQFTRLIPDVIEAYIPNDRLPTNIYIADTNKTVTHLYDESFLDKKDQYAYFLGGVHALMQLTTPLEPDDIEQDNLLVIKDSYAHNVIPFLTLDVPDLHVIDIRFYNGNISEYMADHHIDHVLFLFNTATFVDNIAILKLLWGKDLSREMM